MNRKPAMAFHPGEYLQEELEARGWTLSDLLTWMHAPPRMGDRRRSKLPTYTGDELAAVLNGQMRVTELMAFRLSRALGTSVELWLALQATWDALPDRRSVPPKWEGET